MINWKKYFDAIYCLSYVGNIDKRIALVKELRRVGIEDAEIFRWKITVDNKFYEHIWKSPTLNGEKWWLRLKGALNGTMGHYEIMKECQALGYNRVLIIEDDIRFLKDLDEIEKILDNIPDYDIMLLDKFRPKVIPFEPVEEAKKNDKINDYFYSFNNVKLWSAACYALSRRALNLLPRYQEAFWMPADHLTNRVNNEGRVVLEDKLLRVTSYKNLAVQDMSLKKEPTQEDARIYEGIADLSEYDVKPIVFPDEATEHTPNAIERKRPEKMPKYSVLTYIFGGYEKVHEILKKNDNVEYVLVTDDKELKSDTWNVVYDESLEGLSTFDKCYQVRFHPFNYVNNDIVVRIDGNIIIKDNIDDVVGEFVSGNYDMSLMIHPTRNTMDKEYAVWEKVRKYPHEQSEKCLKMMKNFGYDLEYRGLYQGSFIIQNKNKVNNDFNDITYSLLKALGDEGKIERLDQTISSFVLNTQFQDIKVMPVSESLITNSAYFQWCLHGEDVPIDEKKNTIKPFLFNKPCEIVEF